MTPEPTTPEHRLPLVSVILPIRNEARHIGRTLRAVLGQNYPVERMEVIVADGMSTDATREIVRQWQAEHPRLRLIDNPARIVPAGMNAAMGAARGAILVRIDGHCRIGPDHVRYCVARLEQDGVEGVGGPIRTVGHTLLGRTIAAAMSSTFGVGGSTFRVGSREAIPVDTVPFPAYTAALVRRAGPYDATLACNEDDEYNYRLRKLGATLLLAPELESRYYCRGSLRALARQYVRYGLWKVRVLQKHPRQMQTRHFAPGLFIAVLVTCFALAPWLTTARWLGAAAPAAYATVALAASVAVAARHGWRMVGLLPIVFAVLHVSYGIGFLCGLVRFAPHWRNELAEPRPWEGEAPAEP